jgi:hypothetical protein
MSEPVFMKLGMYTMPSVTISTVYPLITPINNTNTAASEIVLFYWLHFAYILKLSFNLYQILKLQWKERRQLVLPRTSCFNVVYACYFFNISRYQVGTAMGLVFVKYFTVKSHFTCIDDAA